MCWIPCRRLFDRLSMIDLLASREIRGQAIAPVLAGGVRAVWLSPHGLPRVRPPPRERRRGGRLGV
ncbi:hypothetical protein STRAU_2196 [Streptomyces aurantiacus JA 4570]|uniref:Uncharacterized protein n=1 Tax=Streptomyces aurantiacus JA 4570 TaxID=1286094 RepID=S3ZMK3_9ACTN|nr:hypothetical protein STRAU_2196 [Streptomyces aurantiacus JA 4570]